MLDRAGPRAASQAMVVTSSAVYVGAAASNPSSNPSQEAHLILLWRADEHTSAELAELFGVARSTVYRGIKRAESPIAVPTA